MVVSHPNRGAAWANGFKIANACSHSISQLQSVLYNTLIAFMGRHNSGAMDLDRLGQSSDIFHVCYYYHVMEGGEMIFKKSHVCLFFRFRRKLQEVAKLQNVQNIPVRSAADNELLVQVLN